MNKHIEIIQKYGQGKGSKYAELLRTIEEFYNIIESQGIYMGMHYLVDMQYSREDIKSMIELIDNGCHPAIKPKVAPLVDGAQRYILKGRDGYDFDIFLNGYHK